MSKLDHVQSVIEVVFAGKGAKEHWDAKGKENPVEAAVAQAGLGADVIGGTHLLSELGAEHLLKKSPTSFSSYGSPEGRIKGFGTPILGAALLALNGIQLTCGIGDPETGDRFTEGADHFNTIADTLKGATPTEQWHGSGSDAYAAQNDLQQDRAAKMAKIDAEVKGIIAGQAGQLEKTRMVLDVAATYLTVCIPIAIVIGKIPPTGPAQQMAFEMSAVAIAMPPVLGAVTTMGYLATDNAQKFQKAANAYREVAAGAKPAGAPPGSMSPPHGNTTPAPWSPSGGTSTGTGEGSIDV
ncbi:EspA/EspE family type VII secretion system effector [Mycolicibacterium setense]|uniref:EspA/EspE family type VII secretion system effector n=1 Tax=Mycolicibacterium setense TaxID=431269 RepID=UPI00068F7A1A|nr:EspA/EspE family type VII secretion system effector [Mycolicibacterium setense]